MPQIIPILVITTAIIIASVCLFGLLIYIKSNRT